MALNLFGIKKPVKHSTAKKVVKKQAPKPVSKPVKKIVHKPIKKTIPKPVKKVDKKIEPIVHDSAPKVKVIEINKMDDQKAFDMIKQARFPLLNTIFIKKEADLELIKKIGYPCYMKASGSKIIHKTEIGGVIKVNTEIEAKEAFNKLIKMKQVEKIIVQESKQGFELIVGAKSDSQFGHLVSVGIGGIYTEILRDVSFRICPLGEKDAETMLKELKGFDIISGARGQKAINLKAVCEVLGKICKFATTNKIKEMDINPLICDGKDCYISDVRIII